MNSEEKHSGRVAATVIPRTQFKEEYLVCYRKDLEKWEFPGGKEEPGKDQDILHTAEREIREELGLEIDAKKASEENSWNAGGYEIVPVLSRHSYENAEEVIDLKEEKHSEYLWIKPGKQDIDLGKERNCLEAFDLV